MNKTFEGFKKYLVAVKGRGAPAEFLNITNLKLLSIKQICLPCLNNPDNPVLLSRNYFKPVQKGRNAQFKYLMTINNKDVYLAMPKMRRRIDNESEHLERILNNRLALFNITE